MTAKVKYVDGKTFIFTEHFWQWNFMLQQYDFTPNVMGGGKSLLRVGAGDSRVASLRKPPAEGGGGAVEVV